ncbi:MAG: hypothetical protein N3D17_05395 [bacterium]|nr:hypothetical protein [bacterium]
MKICTLYLKYEKVIYRITGTNIEEGAFNSEEVEAFLDKNRPDILNIIISKPHLIFRRVEFPFRNKRKIRMVIPSEIEETLPDNIDNFLFSLDFFPLNKNGMVVNIYGVPSVLIDFWRNIANKHRTKLYFFLDTLLLLQFLKQSTDEKNHISIYEEEEYILLNIVENGILTGSYSYHLTGAENLENTELIKEIINKKGLPLFICGPGVKTKELAISEKNIRYLDLPRDISKKYLFHYLASIKAFKRDFLSLKHSIGIKIPVSDVAIFVVFLFISFFSFSPYFKVVEKQKEIRGIEEEMKQIFVSTFPDIQNVVNPLIQAREKIMKTDITDVKKGVPSVLKVMADITTLFPDNMDAKIDIFRIAGDTITLSGTADSLKTLEKIKERIDKSEKFSVTDIGTISFDTKNRANFSITLKVH